MRFGGLKDRFLDSGKISKARILQQPALLLQQPPALQAMWQGKVSHIGQASQIDMQTAWIVKSHEGTMATFQLCPLVQTLDIPVIVKGVPATCLS